MDWSKGFSATYYMSIVDPVTWRDVDRIEIKGGEISRSESELVESADVDCVRYDQSSERYVRIWLNTKQGGGRSSHIALFTGLATSPDRDINGTLTTNKVQCYSVLKPAKDVLLQRGWYAPAGMSGAFIVKDLLSIIPAPVKIEGSAPNLAQAVIAENGESHLSMAWKVLNAINWRIRIEGDGTVVLCSQADSVSAIFDPLSNDVIEPQITVEYDWYGCPNVFRAVMDDISAVARDDDPDSPLSTVSRGREIWMEETDCDLNTGETISQYAHRRLKEEQSIAMKVSYDRRFIPSVRVGDLIGLRIPAHKITGTFIVESHTVEIGHGARTSEDVRRVSNKNVMNVGSMFNSYNSSVSPVETDVPIKVTKDFNDWSKADSFTFDLAAVTENAPMPALTEATATQQSPTAAFGEVAYTKAGKYEYAITERNGGADGVSYDTEAHKVVVDVTKADDATNALTATVKYDGADSLTVTNTYKAVETSAPIKVTKDFNDWTKADSFEFTLEAKNNAPMPGGVEGNKMTATATSENHDAVFGTITYEKTDTYNYTITETKGDADGVTYDTKAYDVQVAVTKAEDETNAMTATVTYDKDKTALIVQNTFKPSQGIVLQATKSFTGTTWTDDYTFDFVLESVKNAPMPVGAKDGKMTVTATKDAPIAVFGSVTYDKAGTYEYTITEQNGGKDDVAYDTTPHKVVVTVAKDENNQLTATAAYDGGPSLTINNTYSKSEPVNLTATKAFNDWGKATKFTFNLAAVDGAPMPEGTTDGVKAATATKGAPLAVFGDITFEKAGTYKYTITEVNDGIDGVSYDTTPHEVVVTVTKASGATNKLTATVTYDKKSALEIINTYSSVTTAQPIKVTKSFNDWGKADSFTFNLAAVTENAPMPAKTQAVATKAAPVADFGKITFEKAGKYEYTITERNGGADGVSYDTKAHKVVVTVTKANDATNKLTATVTYDKKSALEIINTYSSVTTAQPIKVTKSFNDWGKADSFTFNLAAVTENAPMPAKTQAVATKAAPVADFGKITFEKAGKYEYTITERNGGADGVSYDTKAHKVVVTVTKANDATNKLTASVKYDGNDSLTVTNTYTASEAYAVFDSSDGSFTFFRDAKGKYTDGQVSGRKRYYTGFEDITGETAPSWIDLSHYEQKNTIKTVTFKDKIKPKTCYMWFNGAGSLVSITGLDKLDTSSVTSMRFMFTGCSKLTSLDVSHFNTKKVTSMRFMFNSCSSLTSLDLSSFNTAAVTDMRRMFYDCYSLKTIYASSLFTTDAVSSSDSMFYNCTSLVGGAGTEWERGYTDKTYARIDGGPSNMGYFTAK